jgi:hypothetical protein
MVNATYMQNRVKYARPQAMLWSRDPGTLVAVSGTDPVEYIYAPTSNEIDSASATNENFIILSDHNRSAISISPERIENRKRMINGRMRSHHIADKLTISVSWQMLPSRAFTSSPEFDLNGQTIVETNTADGGAGGEEMLSWYENNTGSFWVYLAYDKYRDFGTDSNAYGHLAQYNQVIEMYIADFNYSIEKRGGTNFDFWNVSVKLEEA